MRISAAILEIEVAQQIYDPATIWTSHRKRVGISHSFLQCLIQMWVHFPQNTVPQAEKCMIHLQQEESNPKFFLEHLSPSVTFHYQRFPT